MSNIIESNLDWSTIFRLELRNICIYLKNNIHKLQQEESILNDELLTIALDFYEKFKDSPIPISPPDPLRKKYASTQITLQTGCLMVPYHLYLMISENNNLDLDTLFGKNLFWMDLLSNFFEISIQQRKSLSETDIQICKMISRYRAGANKTAYPLTAGIISARTRLKSHKAIRKSWNSLIDRLILYNYLMLNPWKLGWDLTLISYNRKNDLFYEQDRYLSIWTIAKEILFTNRAFRIIQEPRVKDTFDSFPLPNSNDVHIDTINSLTFNWNLAQLKVKESESFSYIPNFGIEQPEIIDPLIKYDNNSNSDWIEDETLYNEHRKEILIKVARYITKYDMPLLSMDDTSKRIGITYDQLNFALKFLFSHNIISFASRFKFIGCSPYYNFLIEGINGKQQKQIALNLYQLPFSMLWYGENTLAGVCNIPNNWINDFMRYFSYLMTDNKANIYLGYAKMLESWWMKNIIMPQNHVISTFGSEIVI